MVSALTVTALLLLAMCILSISVADPLDQLWIARSKGKQHSVRQLLELGRRRKGLKGKCITIPDEPVGCNSTKVRIGEPCVMTLAELKPTQASVGMML